MVRGENAEKVINCLDDKEFWHFWEAHDRHPPGRHRREPVHGRRHGMDAAPGDAAEPLVPGVGNRPGLPGARSTDGLLDWRRPEPGCNNPPVRKVYRHTGLKRFGNGLMTRMVGRGKGPQEMRLVTVRGRKSG